MRIVLLSAAVAAACCGVSSAQGPDDYGYVAFPIVPNYLDIDPGIGGPGTALGLAGVDNGGATAAIGFPFDFYGSVVTSLGVSSNGYMANDPDLTDTINTCPLANGLPPNRTIAPFWDDLSLTAHGEVYTATLGPVGQRVFIVQWTDVHAPTDTAASLSFQVQIRESDGSIEFHYSLMADSGGAFDAGGGGASIGIEGNGGVDGLEIFCNDAGAVALGDAYRIERLNPFIDPPPMVDPGGTVVVTGVGDPFVFFVIGFSSSAGPICPCGPLPQLALGLDALTSPLGIIGAGMTAPDGTFASQPQAVPLTGADCFVAHFQALTFDMLPALGPSTTIKVSNPATTTVVPGGGNPQGPYADGLQTTMVSDLWQFTGTAGETVSIRLCRAATGQLDPFVCLIAPSGAVEAEDDDSPPSETGCPAITGPGENSFIGDHTLMESGTYTIRATAFQGQGNEIGPYTLTLLGCTGMDLPPAPTVDEDPSTCQ